MKAETKIEIEELAREYEDKADESPSIMGASCFGGGGSTTSKSPGCSDLSDEQPE